MRPIQFINTKQNVSAHTKAKRRCVSVPHESYHCLNRILSRGGTTLNSVQQDNSFCWRLRLMLWCSRWREIGSRVLEMAPLVAAARLFLWGQQLRAQFGLLRWWCATSGSGLGGMQLSHKTSMMVDHSMRKHETCKLMVMVLLRLGIVSES